MSINNSYLLPTTERRTAPLLPAAERRTAPPPADGWRHAIGAAFASVRAYTLEGLCLHAMALHPEFFWSLGEESDQADLLATTVWPAEHDAIPQSQRAMVTVKDLWPDEPDEATQMVSWRTVEPLGLRQGGPADESLLQGGSPGWRPWLASIAARLWTRMREARERRRSIAALHALDDRTLKDMGLDRHQIEHAVIYGRPLY
jgi:uncharacterized protein YjiS (DUF1127 family)